VREILVTLIDQIVSLLAEGEDQHETAEPTSMEKYAGSGVRRFLAKLFPFFVAELRPLTLAQELVFASLSARSCG
jgi:hypothetical protein